METLLKHDKKPVMMIQKKLFTSDECTYLLGVLLYKNDLLWNEYRTTNERWNMITFSNGRKYKYIREMPYPLSKNTDIFMTINSKLKDVLITLHNDDIISYDSRRYIDQWVCYLYEDGDNSSPEIIQEIQEPNTPIILIILGQSRYILIKSKKTKKTIFRQKVREGSIIIMLESFIKHYKYQVPIEDVVGMNIQMSGSFIKWN